MNKPTFSRDEMQAAFNFAEEQTTHVEKQVNEVRYPDIQYQALVPVDTSAHPFAKSITYYSSDKFGKAGWINGNADDIPRAGTELAKHETSVYMAGIGYGWGYEQINQAQMLGINLPNEDAKSARRACEEMIDRIAMNGDEEKGFTGLTDHADVAATAVSNGDWDDPNTTEDQILADVNTLILGVASETLFTSLADTLLLPPEKLNTLATKRLGDTGMTLLEFLRKNNTYTSMTGKPLTIRAVRGLLTAGAGGVARMVAYRRNPEVLKLHIPMPHRFLPLYQEGPMNFLVPGVFRLGGLDVRRPKEIRYGDGI